MEFETKNNNSITWNMEKWYSSKELKLYSLKNISIKIIVLVLIDKFHRFYQDIEKCAELHEHYTPVSPQPSHYFSVLIRLRLIVIGIKGIFW